MRSQINLGYGLSCLDVQFLLVGFGARRAMPLQNPGSRDCRGMAMPCPNQTRFYTNLILHGALPILETAGVTGFDDRSFVHHGNHGGEFGGGLVRKS